MTDRDEAQRLQRLRQDARTPSDFGYWVSEVALFLERIAATEPTGWERCPRHLPKAGEKVTWLYADGTTGVWALHDAARWSNVRVQFGDQTPTHFCRTVLPAPPENSQ